MYICICKAITAEQIRDAVRSGATSVEDVKQHCEAGADCGTCRFKVHQIIKSSQDNGSTDNPEAIAI